MDPQIYLDHIYRLWMGYDLTSVAEGGATDDAYKEYLIALSSLVAGGTRIDDIVNVEDFMLKCLAILHNRFTEDEWSTILWRVIDSLPEVLNERPSEATRRNILVLFKHMPFVAVECKKICAPHLFEFMRARPVDVASPRRLRAWIEAFKADILKNKDQ